MTVNIWNKSRVWMVRSLPATSWFRGGGVTPSVEGTLTWHDDRVEFTPSGGDPEATAIAFSTIRKVRRAHGGPVIELNIAAPSDSHVVWFYFVKPVDGVRRWDGRGVRNVTIAQSVGRLGAANAMWGDEVSSWYERIRAWRPGGA
jgi:hypothetical protein